MKNAGKKIIWILAIIAVVYAIISIIFLVFGKAIVISQIEKNLKVKTRIESVGVTFPHAISIRKLDIEGLFTADAITASPSILGFFAGKIVLNSLKIIRPEITITKDSDGTLNFPVLMQKGAQPPVLLTGLKIQEGKVTFIDKKLDSRGYKITVGNIAVRVSKVSLPPTSLYTRFNVSADLLDSNNNSSGKAQASGWIDFGPKNMDGKLELMDVEATALAPYYQNIISTKKLLSAKLNFNADMKAKDNDLSILCHSEFSNVIYEKSSPQENKQDIVDIFPNVLDIFSNA